MALKVESSQQFRERTLMSTIWDMVYQIYGEFGASQTSMSMVQYDGDTETLIVKCSLAGLEAVRTAIAAVTEIEKKPSVLHVVAVSGTLKALRSKLQEHGSEVTSYEKSQAVEDQIRRWLKGCRRVVVVGIGNELRRDDFVGVKIVRDLKGRVPKQVMLIESETVPESFIEPVISFSPTHVLLIDAGLVGLEPGHAKFAKSSKVWRESMVAISTHALPLKIFCEYVSEETRAEVALLIIQPGRTDFGEGLTMEMERAAHELIRMLLEIFRTTSPR